MTEPVDLLVDGKQVTLSQILDFIDGNEDAIPYSGVKVNILPPTNATGDITDEDSGDEENPRIDNVPGSQLNAPAFIATLDNGLDPERDNAESETFTKKSKTTRIRRRMEYQWENADLVQRNSDWPLYHTAKYKERTPLEYFQVFFDSEMIQMMVKYTNRYANQRNRNGDISEDEMQCFIAVLLLSGYVVLPRKELYWETSVDTHNTMVSEAISRDRFKFIMTNLHVCDNTKLNTNDKFAKVRKLIKNINQKCIDNIPHTQAHSVDESMVPYFGKHGTKQFIKGKPIRYGYKFWCGGTSTGYLAWLEPYQGAGTLLGSYDGKGLGYSVVMTYADLLPKDFPYEIYFDNFFTSIHLLEDLYQQNIRATGTIRSNRIMNCNIMKSDVLKKRPRGEFDFRSDESKRLLICTWNDNSVVTIATLSGLIQAKPVQRKGRKRPRTADPQKSKLHLFAYKYWISHTQGKQTVCKDAFKSVHGVTDDRVRRLTKLLAEDKVPKDLRGISLSGNSKSRELIDRIKWHIESFPVKDCHYTSRSYRYLSEKLNVKIMHQLFLEKFPGSDITMPKIKNKLKYSKQYSEENLQKALQAVNGGMSKIKASELYNVPRSTIQFRLSNKFSNKTSHGPSPYLTEVEEDVLVKWIIESQQKGFPRRKDDLQEAVKEFFDKTGRDNPFKDNCPGKGWYARFLRRHPVVAHRTPEAVTAANPSRIFNGDETGFQLCAKQKYDLAPKGCKNVYEIDSGNAKSSITVMFTFSASGEVTPPMIIHPLKHMMPKIRESVPDEYGIGLSDNGKAEVFYEYISNVLYPYLEKQLAIDSQDVESVFSTSTDATNGDIAQENNKDLYQAYESRNPGHVRQIFQCKEVESLFRRVRDAEHTDKVEIKAIVDLLYLARVYRVRLATSVSLIPYLVTLVGTPGIQSESSNSDKISDAEDDSDIEDEEELVNEHTTLPMNRDLADDWNTCTMNTRNIPFTGSEKIEVPFDTLNANRLL
ncbi:tc5 transposase dna-binding domain [Holotrichia oblita]|uniref:Tc5 transposase dna-binding domain n=1 Tax=Holotrichia oblita TaxID=644536 RepID=A0ACB9T976_HOLOL|nr:tc5 transposase dna-binding domain [Holotrichia oblita]